MSYAIFWGDTHHNTYMGHRQDPSLESVLRFAATHLDFYTGAYYTRCSATPPFYRNRFPFPRKPPRPTAASASKKAKTS